MDFGALPPEINSGLMYSGPGSGPMLAAATAWSELAGELHSAAASYGLAISDMTEGPWRGPASASMASAAAPYVAWMTTTAAQAEQAATQAMAAANAYHAAFAATVPPPVIAANRAQLLALIATNFFGQNTPAIAATEAEYAEMWAQDATAMYSYAANSAAASTLTPLTSPPQTTNAAGAASQAAAVTQAGGTSAGTSQASLSQLITTLLHDLASPGSSTSSGSGLSPLALGPSGTTTTASTTGFGGIDTGSFLQSVLSEYAYLPGFFGMFAAMDALGPIMSQLETIPSAGAGWAADAAAADAAAGAAAADAAAGAAAAGGALGSTFDGGFGAWGGLGEAASVGALSVPPSWGWAAADPLEILASAGVPLAGGVPLALPTIDLGAGAAPPLFFGGLPRAAGVGAAAGAGAAAVKYGSRLTVMARPPAAGYPAEPVAASIPQAAVHAGYTTHGHPPPGYRAAIVYVPTNEPAPATT